MMNIRLSGLCVAKPLFGRGLGRPDLGEAFHHLLHQFIGSRAIFNVLFMHMCIVTEFFCEMRKSCTIGGPYCINTAFIIFQIEELAGLFFIHPVAIFFLSLCSHCFLNSSTVWPKWADILLRSAGVNVGVIVLQQLAQLRQSTSCHTSFSNAMVKLFSLFGGSFSSLVRNLLKLRLVWPTFFLKERRFTGFISLMGRR